MAANADSQATAPRLLAGALMAAGLAAAALQPDRARSEPADSYRAPVRAQGLLQAAGDDRGPGQDPAGALACVARETVADAVADACILDADPNGNFGTSPFL